MKDNFSCLSYMRVLLLTDETSIAQMMDKMKQLYEKLYLDNMVI